MLTLRRETDYAVQMLKALSRARGKSLSLHIVSEQTGISFTFAQKIARKLRLAKMISSHAGVMGGYTLKIPAQKINLKKIVEAIEGSCELFPCAVRQKTCVCSEKCSTLKKFNRINKKLTKVLEEIKLKDL